LLRDPPTCALHIDPSVALRYRPIAQIAQTRATHSQRQMFRQQFRLSDGLKITLWKHKIPNYLGGDSTTVVVCTAKWAVLRVSKEQRKRLNVCWVLLFAL